MPSSFVLRSRAPFPAAWGGSVVWTLQSCGGLEPERPPRRSRAASWAALIGSGMFMLSREATTEYKNSFQFFGASSCRTFGESKCRIGSCDSRPKSSWWLVVVLGGGPEIFLSTLASFSGAILPDFQAVIPEPKSCKRVCEQS